MLALPADTTKVLKLSDLCYAYRRADPDSALFFGNAALQLARKLEFKRGEAQACNDLAIIHIDHSDFETADSLLLRSLALRTQLADSAGMAAVHNKRGIIFQARFMLEDALGEDLKALAIYERTGPPAYEAVLLNNIAILQFNLKRLSEALATQRRALAIRERIGDQAGIAASQGNMANIEVQLGDTAAAVAHLNAAIAHFKNQGQMPELAVQLNNLAGINLAQGDYTSAAKRYGQALAIRQASGEKKAIASSLIGLGGTRLRQGQFGKARSLLLKGLAMARSVDARSEQMQAYLELGRLHARQNHGDSTLWYLQQHTALKDSIFSADLNTQLAHAETKFETAKKERQILAQRAEIAELERRSEQRKVWLLTALGGSALVVLLLLLLFQTHKRKVRARQDALVIIEREAGLRGVLEATEVERKRMAAELHDGVGQLLTGLKLRLEGLASNAADGQAMHQGYLHETLDLVDEAGREVRQIAHAMMPKALGELGLVPALADMLERALGGAGIRHNLESTGLHERLAKPVETGVFRIAQELVQNTLKHAQAKLVDVQLLKNNGYLVMIYEDDGKGMVATNSPGIGVRNMQERARALHGTFRMENGGHQGMVATLRLPLN